jgi:hypothetical protein
MEDPGHRDPGDSVSAGKFGYWRLGTKFSRLFRVAVCGGGGSGGEAVGSAAEAGEESGMISAGGDGARDSWLWSSGRMGFQNTALRIEDGKESLQGRHLKDSDAQLQRQD